MNARPDVVIVGAGIIGLAIARLLALQGLRVQVIDRESPGREATWAAAGMLSPLGEAASAPPMRVMADASLARWPDLAAALREDTTVDVEYATGGAMHVAFDAAGATALDRLIARGAKDGAERWSAEQARQHEPSLSMAVSAAAFIARDHRVDNRRVGQALWAACTGAGVEFRLGARVQQAVLRNDGRRRFAAVRLSGGGEVEAGALVVAAGAWSGQIQGLPSTLPVRPVRGQMFALSPVPGERPVRETIVGPGCYLVPRRSGRVLVGATVEDVGFQPGPTPRGLSMLMDAALRIAPPLADLAMAESWAGYRPGTPDDMPILGRDPDADGVFYATGHFRNGILLAPVSAEIVAAEVTAQPVPITADAFRVERFRTGGEPGIGGAA